MWRTKQGVPHAWAAVVGIALTFLLAGGATAKPSVTDVRLGLHPDKVRFVLEISQAPAYRIFTLPDPYRVVIDLPEIDWQLAQKPAAHDVGFIEALRFGLFAPGTSRVVLDAERPVKITNAFVLEPREGYPYRLVIDMVGVTRASFLEARNRGPITSDKPLPKPQPVSPEPADGREDSRLTIVIDPGHGGVDPGAIGTSGLQEKDLVYTYAKVLQRELGADRRYDVVLTRDKDIFLRLRDRVAAAQHADGELFISLHANTNPSNRVRGASVYTLSEQASDAEAAALAAKENKADLIAGVDLNRQTEVVSQILIDLAQRETMNNSKQFANVLVDELGETVKLLNNTHRYAGFAVLKSPNVPSVLLEIGYMSHPAEENALKSAGHQRKVADAIHRAVDRYFAWQEARSLQ